MNLLNWSIVYCIIMKNASKMDILYIKEEEVFNYFHVRGYTLKKIETQGKYLGCNQYVFQKISKQTRG